MLYLVGTGHAASLGGGRPAARARRHTTASRCRAPTRGSRSRCRSSSARRTPSGATRESAPLDGGTPLPTVETLAFEDVSFAYRAERPVLNGDQLRGAAAARRSASSAPPARASRRSSRSCCGCARPDSGRYLVNGVPAERVRARGLAPAGRLRAPGTAPAARLRGGEHPLLPRPRRRGGRTGRGAWRASTTTSCRLAAGLRHDRRPARRRGLRRPAAAHLPRPRARGAPGGARARRAHQRARPALGDADPGVADGAQARADAVHRRPPHVHARHLRPRDGDPRRPPGGVRHDRPAAAAQPLLPLRLALAAGAPAARCRERDERPETAHGGPGHERPAAALASRRAGCPPRRGCPTSSSSASQERHDRAVRDAAAPPADLHARRQGAVVLRRRAARAHAAAPGRHAGDARGVPRAVRGGAAASSASARPRRCTCGRARPPGGSPRCSPRRGSSRSCASPRASCARCTCSSSRPTSRPRPTCAGRSRSRRAPARGAPDPAPHLLAAGAAVLRARALRRAAAPLPASCSAASRCWCWSTTTSARDNEATVRAGAALPRGRRHACRSRRARPTRRCAPRSQRLHELVHALSVGHGPGLAGGEGRAQGADARAGCGAARSTRRSAASSSPSRPPPDEELMAELRRRFKRRGRGAERVPGTATS